MKEMIVGSALGSAFINIRDWFEIRSLPLTNPEKASMIANRIIADRLIHRISEDRSNFLDIGAHIGSIFSNVYRNNRTVITHAIEADPEKALFLESRFNFCNVINCAVGDSKGKIKFYRDNSQLGYSSILQKTGHMIDEIEVEIFPLDAIFPNECMSVIKIDVEGAELGVLRGGKQLISRSRPVIMFESNDIGANALGYSPDMIWNWLNAEGFDIFSPDRVAHEAPPINLDSFLDSHHYPFRTHNYFAIPAELRTIIRNKARKILSI